MLNAFVHYPYRRQLISMFIFLAFCTSAFEIVDETLDGQSLLKMGDDLANFIICTMVMVLLASEYIAQKHALHELKGQLEKARGQLENVDSHTAEITSQYRQVMQKQFEIWLLTKSEQEVVIGLLKGLSFREIAELRGTREKTVRQQAMSVYKKAGVSGRNELAAWFFEDMLDPR